MTHLFALSVAWLAAEALSLDRFQSVLLGFVAAIIVRLWS